MGTLERDGDEQNVDIIRKMAFFWKRELGICETCVDLVPASGMSQDCGISSTKKSFCTHTCDEAGATVTVGDKSPLSLKMTCKCPRVNGTRVCGWYNRKLGGLVEQSTVDGLMCP